MPYGVQGMHVLMRLYQISNVINTHLASLILVSRIIVELQSGFFVAYKNLFVAY